MNIQQIVEEQWAKVKEKKGLAWVGAAIVAVLGIAVAVVVLFLRKGGEQKVDPNAPDAMLKVDEKTDSAVQQVQDRQQQQDQQAEAQLKEKEKELREQSQKLPANRLAEELVKNAQGDE